MKKLRGIRKRRDKWEVYIRVAGTLHTKTFDELDVPAMRTWQERQRTTAPPPPGKGTLTEKAEAYFETPEVAAQPFVDQKKAHLKLWLDALGWNTSIDDITRDLVEHVLQDWLKTLAPATVYHRRSTLLSVFTHAYGEHALNVVLGSTVPAAWTPRDQSVTYETLAKILAAMPAERRPIKGIRQPSVARIVTEVLMHTGLRPIDLWRVRRPDVNWTAGTVQIQPSGKGQKKVPNAWTCVLSTEALAAMRAFDLANLYGAFSRGAVSHSYKRACRRVLGHDTPVHLYAQRHSVGADTLRASRDTTTVGRVLGHAPGSRMSEQYSMGAHAEVDRAAVEAMAAARRTAIVPTVTNQLAAQLAATPKLRKRNKLRRVS